MHWRAKAGESEIIMKARPLVWALALVALTLVPLAVAAQSSLPVSEAAGFLGNWTITVESPQGSLEQKLALNDAGGKVQGVLSSQLVPEPQKIDDITKDGGNLVVKFAAEFSGMPFKAKITLTPDGPNK